MGKMGKKDDEREASLCWGWKRNGIGIRVMWLELETTDKYRQMRLCGLRIREGFGKEYAASKVIMPHPIHAFYGVDGPLLFDSPILDLLHLKALLHTIPLVLQLNMLKEQ